MRKYIFLLLICIALLAGCGENTLKLYESVISDTTNNNTVASPEINYWDGVYFEKSNMDSFSCSVLGALYTGKYENSIIDKMNSYTTDFYVTDEKIQFGIRKDNSQVVLLNLMTSDYFESESKLSIINDPYGKAIELAEEIIKNYPVKKVDYERTVEISKLPDGNEYYFVTYKKFFQKYETSDFITIKVSSKGSLASVIAGDIGAFENINFDIEDSLVDKSVLQKVSDLYSGTSYKLLNSEILSQKLVLTPDNSFCVLSKVSLETEDTNGNIYKSGVEILTAVG